jgi:hypothetical protein
MEPAQTSTKWSKQQQEYITWCATGLYWPPEAEEPIEVEYVTDYSQRASVPRRTLYNWEAMDGFWDEVNGLRTTALDRKINKYYKWAEEIAKPLIKPIKDKAGNVVDAKIIRPGNVQAIALLIGQAGRKAAEKSEVKHEVHTIDSILD